MQENQHLFHNDHCWTEQSHLNSVADINVVFVIIVMNVLNHFLNFHKELVFSSLHMTSFVSY